MLFAMIGKDGPKGTELRKIHRDAHLANLRKLQEAGRLPLAGPFIDGSGSLVVFDAENIEEARKIADSDPYVVQGIFESYELHPFNRVF